MNGLQRTKLKVAGILVSMGLTVTHWKENALSLDSELETTNTAGATITGSVDSDGICWSIKAAWPDHAPVIVALGYEESLTATLQGRDTVSPDYTESAPYENTEAYDPRPLAGHSMSALKEEIETDTELCADNRAAV